MKIKNLISVLLGLGIIFVGGEKLALQGKATSVKPRVPDSTAKILNYKLSNSEVLELTNSDLCEPGVDESSLLGESSLNSDANESLGNLEGDASSLDSEVVGDSNSREEGSENSDGVSDLSEASSTVQSTDEQSSTSSNGDSAEVSDSTGDSTGESSSIESSMGAPAETGDRAPIGFALVALAVSSAAAAALVGKKNK